MSVKTVEWGVGFREQVKKADMPMNKLLWLRGTSTHSHSSNHYLKFHPPPPTLLYNTFRLFSFFMIKIGLFSC